jgi:TPR repeat protein/cell division septation protein DedD
MRSAAALGVILALAAPVAAAKKKPKPPVAAEVVPSVRQGVELWRAGDYAGAVAMWQPFAVAGDKDALFNMGQAHKLGRAVARDPVLARDYYRRAAVQGHLPAQANLGILLFQAGEKPEAMKWLKAAADKNEMRAQYVLGVAAWNGDGVPRDLTLAYAYLARASAQGLPEATTALNTLTGVISPLQRANGWAIATSLQAGNGIPSVFSGEKAPVAVAQADSFSRDQVIKPLPKAVEPVRTEVVPVVSKPVPVVAPVVSKPVVVAAVPAVVAPKPVPVVVAQAEVPAVVARPAAAMPAVKTVELPASSAQAVSPKPIETAAKAAEPAPKPAAKPAEAKPKPVETAAAKPKPGGWRVQLGAFSKKTQAEAAWTEVKAKQKAVVGSKQPIYEASGEITKLQLGPFANKDAARDACAKIAFSGRACFVTQG